MQNQSPASKRFHYHDRCKNFLSLSLLVVDISTRSDDEILKLTKELTKKTDVIMTPLCYVIFPPGGYGYSFPVPTAFNPPKDRIKRLFLECKDLMKRFKRHGRRMSLHEILCDLYECDPKTTWLSDGKILETNG